MAVLKNGTTIGGNAAIHAANMADHGIITTSSIGSYALTGLPSNAVTTAGGQTIGGTTYFSGGESLNLYGIRGRFSNEYIHLYNKVGIGHPSGWGQGEGNTPAQGLSTYGGINIAYGNDNSAIINTYTRINKNWAGGDYGAEQLTIRGTYPSIALRSTTHDNKWLIHNDDTVAFYYGGGVDNNSWSKRFFIPTDGNIWMSWAGDYLSNLLGAKQNASSAINTSNIGSQSVNYATTSGSTSGNAATATRVSGQSGYPHAGTGMFAFYNWGGSNGGGSAPNDGSYTVGISVGSHPNDQAYGFQIARNMWNTGLWTRGYDSGFGEWVRLIDSSNIGSQSVSYASSAGNADTLDSLDSSEFARGRSAYQVLNLDTIKQPGLYQYDGGIGGTQPEGTDQANLRTIEIGSGGRYTQMAFDWSSEQAWFRRQTGSEWSTWREFIHSGNIGSQSVSYASSAGNADTVDGWHRDDLRAWGNLTGVPSTFTPSAHNHDDVVSNTGIFASATDGGRDCYLSIGDDNPSEFGYDYGGLFTFYGDTSRDASVIYAGGGTFNRHLAASIFYDVNDSGYYLDPNGTSNLNKFSDRTMGFNGMNPMSANSPYVTRYNASANYRTGSMGYGSIDLGSIGSNWGSGFIDSWSSPGQQPNTSTSHWVGLQSIHYGHQDGTNFYGFQMVSGADTNRFYLRAAWPTPLSWQEIITSGNIGSQSVNYASSAGNSATTSQRSYNYLYTTDYLESSGAVYGTIFYDNNDRTFYVDPNSSSRVRNLYVGDGGSDWVDTGGWGTQLHVSNGPHSIIRVYARNEGIETGVYSHVGGQSKAGSFSNHDFSIVRNWDTKMTFYSGYTYANGYLQAADSLRAPIFYDSNDTYYYVDPNSRSRIESLYVNRHIDAITGWGNASNVLFLNWDGRKVVLGNGNTGWHDLASALGNDTLISTNRHFFPQGIQPLNMGGAVLNMVTSNVGVASGNREAVTFIDRSVVQAHVSTGSGCTGCCYNWYNTEWIMVDPEKDYEFSVWVKSSGDHNVYMGWHEADYAFNQITSNPYFHTGTNNTGGGWVKIVAKLRNWRTPGSAESAADRYAESNSATSYATDGIMHSNTRYVHIRMGTCYGNSNTTKTYFHLVSIREITGHDQYAQTIAMPYSDGSQTAGTMYLRSKTHWDSVSGIDVIGASGEFRISSDTGAMSVRVDGSFIASDNVYLGTRGVWLSDWLNQSLTTSSSPTFSNVYNNGWFRNYGVTGLYNQDYGTHFYSNGGANWVITGSGGNIELQFRSNHQSTLRGWVYATTSNEIGFLSEDGNWVLRTWNRGVEAYGSMRAPVFYDSSNTTYYGDFADISSMYGLAIRGDQSSTDTSNQIFFWGGGNSTTSAIGFKASGGHFENPTGNGDGYNTYFTMDSDGRGWVFRRGRGGADFTSEFTSGWILNNGIWQSNGSMRAPIFYDSENTAYYLDPNSTSYLYGLQLSGSNYFRPSNWIQFDSNYGLYWPNHNAAHIYAHTGSYGSIRVDGSRNGWRGISFDASVTLMMNDNESGHYKDGYGWQFRWDGGTLYCYKNTYGGGTAATVLDSSNYSGYALPLSGGTVTGIAYFLTNNGGTSGATDSAKLQAYSTGGNSAFMSFHRGGYYAVNMGLDNDNVLRVGGWSAAANRMQLDMSGNVTFAGDVTAYSDARVKENVKTIENALDKTLKLRGVSYNRIDSDDKSTKIGVIAQEILDVVPEVVNQDNDGMYNVSYGNITALLIEAIKEQQKQIEELKSIINGLTS